MKLSSWQFFAVVFAAAFAVIYMASGLRSSPRPSTTRYTQSRGIRTLRETHRIHAYGEINAVAFNPNGNLLAMISHYGSDVAVFDTTTWETKAEFSRGGVGYAGNSLSLLPDGSLIFAAPGTVFHIPLNRRFAPDFGFGPSERFAFEKRNIASPDQVEHLPHLAGVADAVVPGLHSPSAFAASFDGKLIAAANGGGVPILSTQSGLLLKLLVISGQHDLPHDFVESLAFSHDGARLAVGTLSGKVLIYDVASWDIVQTISAEDGYRISALAFSPDGQFLATGRSKNMNLPAPSAVGTEIWRVKDGAKIADVVGGTCQLSGNTNEANVFSLSWFGDYLAVGDEMSFHLWQVANGKVSPLIESDMRYGTLSTAFSPKGVLATAENNELVVYQ